MTPTSLLCVTLEADAFGVAQQLRTRGWQVAHAAGLTAAAQVRRRQGFLAGLMVIGTVTAELEAAIEAFVEPSGGLEWVAVVTDAAALESPGLRALILECFFDHHVLPLDGCALDLRLRHAAQRALLRRRPHPQPEEAGDALGLVGQSPLIAELRRQLRKVAATQAPVLIGGESGSGKELAARAIHRCSARAAGPFVAVNCGAIAPALIQSELFGHERGAFTGATSERRGLIEAAGGGTIFLDEIGDLPLELQTNLLRFLQEKTISRVGAVRSLQVDARVVAASHVDLAEAVATGRFREDLFYRLNVLPIEVPPLRSHLEDVPVLAEHFFRGCLAAGGHPRLRGFGRQAVAAMLAHGWPGNVRELSNRVQRAVVMTDARLIGPADLGLALPEGPAAALGLDAARERAERAAIADTLGRVGHNVTHAARALGVSRMTLYRLMDKHRLAAGMAEAAYGASSPIALPAARPLRTAPSSVAG